jgi:hypothetical protein
MMHGTMNVKIISVFAGEEEHSEIPTFLWRRYVGNDTPST